MIPFGSQRGLGQDLATHLLNQHDNEIVECAQVRGAIAEDLHGAFEEWEIQARGLTKCEKYLYSLSINPDPKQGELTREEYFAYIEKVEQKLGLTDQPRAVVFHEKNGRPHAHVIWSRIDAENEKAVHIAFDKEKLMAVTREFAREHGLKLPRGYETRDPQNDQLSLYEKAQQDETGISKEQRIEEVSDAWHFSDSPRAFVNALEEKGYILATGKRPYVLVDIYGHTNALSKLIEDVNTKEIRKFLDGVFPPQSLPSVEQARALADQHSNARIDAQKNEQSETALEHLKCSHEYRRQELEKEFKTLAGKHHKEREALAARHNTAKSNLRSAYLAQGKWIKQKRYEARPRGLAEFLGRVSGINLLRKKVQRYHDKKRLREFLRKKYALKGQQEKGREALKQKQILQKRELERRDRALKQIEKREIKSLKTELARQQRIIDRSGLEHLPPITLGRAKSPERAGELTKAANVASGIRTKLRNRGQLPKEFERVSDGQEKDEEQETRKPEQKKRKRRRRRRKRTHDPGRGR